jgi:iron complex outermembrane receptor protein
MDDSDVINLDEFEVRAEDVTGYYSKNFLSAYRISTPVRELPFNLDVVTQDFIKDIGASTLEESFAFTPGVFQEVSAGQRSSLGSDQFLVRGLKASRPKRNGFTRYFLLDTTNMAQIEVVKGPASAIFGNAEPGGVINYITKKPNENFAHEVEATAGFWDYYRFRVGSTGPLDEEKKWRYRVDASYLDRGGYRDWEDETREFVSPVLEWRPNSNVTLRADVEIVSSESVPVSPNLVWNPVAFQDWVDRGSPEGIFIGESFNLPRNDRGDVIFTDIAEQFSNKINTGGPDGFDNLDGKGFNFEGNVKLSDGWALRSSFGLTEVIRDRFASNPNRIRLMGDGVQRSRGIRTRTVNTVTSAQLDLVGKFETKPVKHRAILGIEYFGDDFESKNYNYGRELGQTNGTTGLFFKVNPTPAAIGPFSNIQFNEYDLFPVPSLDLPGTRVSETSQQNIGYYFSYMATTFEDRFRLLASLRNDRNSARDELTGESSRDVARVNSTQVGASFELFKGVNLYANYSESFVPVGGSMNALNADRTDTEVVGRPPQLGEGVEAGIKFEAFDGTLTGTLAWYDIERQNVVASGIFTPTTGPNAGIPLSYNFLLEGETSNGYEFELVYQPNSNWQIRAAYAYIDAKSINPQLAGVPAEDYLSLIGGVPENSASIFTKYTFDQDGALGGLAIGGGISYLDERRGGNVSSSTDYDKIILDSYIRADVFASYKWTLENDDTVTVRVNIENVTDETYYVPGPFIGNPINGRLSVVYNF